jgi:hypothetical protein
VQLEAEPLERTRYRLEGAGVNRPFKNYGFGLKEYGIKIMFVFLQAQKLNTLGSIKCTNKQLDKQDSTKYISQVINKI